MHLNRIKTNKESPHSVITTIIIININVKRASNNQRRTVLLYTNVKTAIGLS